MEQCIQTGISKTTSKSLPPINSEVKPMAMQQIVKENPIGMLRKGGCSYIDTNCEVANRFHIEDSPCNYSFASGLSDITVGSQKAGLLKTIG